MMHLADKVVEYVTDVFNEVGRQEGLWGVQTHPDGTDAEKYGALAETQKALVDEKSEEGTVTWADIWLEEVYEALATANVQDLIEELTQAAAVAVSWRRNIESR